MKLSGKLCAIMMLVAVLFIHIDYRAANSEELPAPQLVTDAWMFIAAYKADPEVLKSMLPEGLEPNPEGQVVINMYTVTDGN